MGWSRRTCRTARHARRPNIEALEIRSLLSASPSASHAHETVPPHRARPLHATPQPTQDTSSATKTNFDAIDGASQARAAYGVDGTGLTVAVIDTGVDYTHEALGGGFGPGHKVIAGFDFSDGNPDPMPAPSMPHGTAVAGLIASSDPAHPGVAPGADIVALRVFNDDKQGDFNKVADALMWVLDHHGAYHITTVNLSISDGNNYVHNSFARDGGVGQRITTLIGQLDALNIPVVTATGNSFNGQEGEGFAAIVPDTISVTSTDAGDHIVSNAQRLGQALGGDSATDLAAPGAGVTAPSTSNGFSTVDGTSFSASQVTGAVVLLQQIYMQRFQHLPTVSDLDGWLKQGADPASDPVTGITIGRLDIPKAAGLIPNPVAEVLTPPPASGIGNQGPGMDQGQAAMARTNGANASGNHDNGGGSTHSSDGPAGGSQGPQPQARTTQTPNPPPTSSRSTPPSQSDKGSSGSSSSHANPDSRPGSGSGSTSTTSPGPQQKLLISIDGQPIDRVDRSTLGEKYAQFIPAFLSFQNWGTGPGNGSEGKALRIWTARQEVKGLGASQPTGVVHLAHPTSGPQVIPTGPLPLQGHGEFVRPRRPR
ncbi:MAG TPA: S8 family serine peptidase [Isosphaeraceae bacterium]|nr:S8 family serine peptidase [Isosphaeraceae bacterium]